MLPALLVSGALCYVDLAFIEWHPINEKTKLSLPNAVDMSKNELSRLITAATKVPGCRFNQLDFDDESFVDGKAIPFVLPGRL